ncbi:MAG: PepSY domain-containing protein, partial [Algicola sp.]|nr:PepSY domain-containing protein [Algicola sp.]
ELDDDDMDDDDMDDDDMDDDDMGDDDSGEDDLDEDDSGEGFDKIKNFKISADDDTGEQNEPVMYIVELLDGDYVHTVMINATTGEVVEVEEDSQKALDAAITAATKWAALDTVIANAQAAQAGTLLGIELEMKDAKLVYLVFVDGETQSFEVTVDAAEGTVLSTEPLEMDDDMDDEGEDEE